MKSGLGDGRRRGKKGSGGGRGDERSVCERAHLITACSSKSSLRRGVEYAGSNLCVKARSDGPSTY